MFNSENDMISPGIGVLINGVGLSIEASDKDGTRTRWQKNETFGNFVIEKLNPFGDNGLILFGYRDSDSAITLFILHEKGDPERSPEIPILASVL